MAQAVVHFGFEVYWFRPLEDATAFVWDNKLCLLTNDNHSTHTGIRSAGVTRKPLCIIVKWS